MGIWDELTAELITDTTDREALNGVLSKYPVLAKRIDEGSMRLSDYSNKLNEIGRERQVLKDWRDQNWDPAANGGQGATKREVLLEQQVERLNEAMANGAEMDVNSVWSELQTKLTETGYVNKIQLDERLKGMPSKAELEALGQQIPANMGLIYTRTAPLLARMTQELGRAPKGEEFEGLMNHILSDPAKNMKDFSTLDVAYDTYMAGARAERDLATKKAELETVTKEIEDKKAAAIAAAPQPSDPEAGNVPVAMRQAFAGTNGTGKDKLEGVDIIRGADVLADAGYRAHQEGRLGKPAS